MNNVTKFIITAALATSFATVQANAASYTETAVSDGGSISGKVSLGSAKTIVEGFTISKDPNICGTGTREVPMVQANGDALLNAVVYLEKIKSGKAIPAGLQKITINQEKCTFAPYLSVMVNEGELEAVNSDPTLHNIHTYEQIGRARRTVLNVSQPEKGNVVTKRIKLRKGAGMKIECDAHDFMHAFVFVARNPYFSVVNDKGEFSIGDVPPGEYKINVWHGVLGIQKGTVKVEAGGTASVNFSY